VAEAGADRQKPARPIVGDMTRARWHHLHREGVKLTCLDVPGSEPSVLFLHGLAGRANEWKRTASALKGRHRVLAPDQRGHGRSERRPGDMSPEAFVNDVALWIDELSTDGVILVGQSLGGLTAFLTAARQPSLVRGLVVLQASHRPTREPPSASLDGSPNGQSRSNRLPTRWNSSVAIVGGPGRCDSLESTAQGLMPAFDADIMVATLEAPAGRLKGGRRRSELRRPGR
jgi:pimeloyl-ACP methyl ester carboxylesterase